MPDALLSSSRLSRRRLIQTAGAGALLISRDTLERIRSRFGDDWFRYQDGPDGLRSRSEDMWFYEQARAAGYQPYLDADCACGHVAQFVVDAKWLAPYQDALVKAHQPKEKVAV